MPVLDETSIMELLTMPDNLLRKSLTETERQMATLENHFGGEVKWQEVAKRIDAWATANLPERTVEALSTSVEGVLAMHRMMTGISSCLPQPSKNSNEQQFSEERLKQMMRDSRYWRDQDPIFIERIREGFKRLYGKD